MVKLSIIIPVYNCEKYLDECLESIFAQDFESFEIILVDDGSTDLSGVICDNYSKIKDNICVVHKKNGGMGSARNIGIKRSTGEYITFMDADDRLIEKNYLSSFIQNCDVDYISAGITHQYISDTGVVVDEVVQALQESKGEKIQEFPDIFFVNGFFHSACNKCYSSEIIKANKLLFPGCNVSEDSLFNIAYLSHIKSWRIIDCAGYGYRHQVQSNSVTSLFREEDIDVYISLYQKMQQLSIDKNVVDKTMYYQFYAVCKKCVRSNNLSRKEKKQMLKSIMQKPLVKDVITSADVSFAEKISGKVMASCNLTLIDNWFRILKL